MVSRNAATKPEANDAPPAAKPVADTLAAQDERKRHAFINDPQFQMAEQYRQVWIATIPADHTLSDLMRPDYWMNVANKLRHYAHIECYAEDGSFYIELLCVGKSPNSARMAVLNKVDLNRAAGVIDMGEELREYDIRYAGPVNGFRVVHKASGNIVKANIENEEAARRWLLDYVAKPTRGDRAPDAPAPNSSSSKLDAAVAQRKASAG